MRAAYAALVAAAILAFGVALPAAADPIRWGQDYMAAAKAAIVNHQPIVLLFIGNDTFDDSLFDLPAFDANPDRAQYDFVGVAMDDTLDDDQQQIEASFGVDTYPALLLVEPVAAQGADGKPGFDMKVRLRCSGQPMPACASTIAAAINAGE